MPWSAWMCLLLLGLGCASRSAEPPQRTLRSAPALASTQASSPTSPAMAIRAPVAEPTLLITEPRVLAALEQHGLTLSGLFGSTDGSLRNSDLRRLPRIAPVFEELERELRRAAAADSLAGVNVARFSHRLFDQRFLHLPEASFRLAGVVNRPDRAVIDPTSCGETRLIYRLAYALGDQQASKLPMTLGIELKVPREGSDCRAAALRWVEPQQKDAEARAVRLRSELGPLAPARTVIGETTARVVVNVQLVRWPSTVRPDLGGHAEYLLRSFRADATGKLEPELLENTIDPAAFGSPLRQAGLVTWLADHAGAVDAGAALLPAAWLAARAISVTPRGLSRLANRPFSAALTAQSFDRRDFSRSSGAKSAAGLLRRLDQLSCPGCHQARSVAGFHLLGADAHETPLENALVTPVSPHVIEDLPRRLRIAKELLAGTSPDLTVPFAERASESGGYGAHCSLGVDETFAAWGCAPGLHCSGIEANRGDPVGQCLPTSYEVGDACETGAVVPHKDRRRDRMSGVSVERCGNMICNRSAVGFPGGMCTASCGDPSAVCGPIAVLDPFNACLARGGSFLSCIRSNVRPAGLRGCDVDHACRDDYVCARGAEGGVCLPPYFVFQLRVDGHSSALR